MGEFFLVPGAEGWNLISRPAENGKWRVRAFPTLDEAAQTLSTDDSVVLALPVSAVLAQRMRLPSVEGSELREMVRIQLEKALPFSAEEVTSDFEVIEQAPERLLKLEGIGAEPAAARNRSTVVKSESHSARGHSLCRATHRNSRRERTRVVHLSGVGCAGLRDLGKREA